MVGLNGQCTKSLKDLAIILAPSILLSEGKRPYLIEKINKNCGLESSRFESLCANLLDNLVNHCQQLPETKNSYYSQLGGLVDYALNRTEAALELFRHYIISEENELSEEQKLWIYALFSAGVLQGLGKLQIDYLVDLYDVNGQRLKQWSPLIENMVSVGSHYYFEFLEEGEEDFRRRLNLLIAKQLMPASGFNWIISNPQILAIWLALLNEDLMSAGTLGAILIRADAIAIQRYFHDLLNKGGLRTGSRHGKVATFLDTIPEEVKERMAAVEFIEWVKQALDQGRIMINRPPLFMVPGGMLMSSEIFKLFVRENPEFKNWLSVQNGFSQLGLHRKGFDGSITSRFEIQNAMHEGIVLSNYALVLPDQITIGDSEDKTKTVSAIEFIHSEMGANDTPLYLNEAGEWQQAASILNSPNTNPGAQRGG